MNKIMSLLAGICVVLVFVELRSLVDGPGTSFVGGIVCPQASQTFWDNLLSIYGNFSKRLKANILNSWFALYMECSKDPPPQKKFKIFGTARPMKF